MRKLQKPGKTQVRSGFQPLSGLNVTGNRRAIPHDASTNPARTGSNLKLRKAAVKPARGRKMY